MQLGSTRLIFQAEIIQLKCSLSRSTKRKNVYSSVRFATKIAAMEFIYFRLEENWMCTRQEERINSNQSVQSSRNCDR